jgi:alkyl sulfatase BDS1-like metallo-beta-lactamase superfamily hydrolase
MLSDDGAAAGPGARPPVAQLIKRAQHRFPQHGSCARALARSLDAGKRFRRRRETSAHEQSAFQDFDDAARGFLGTIENAEITNPQGRTVWSLEPYGFLAAEQAPATVNPSLWRQSRLNMQHGLFEVVPGIYQVRGLDIANMTLI